MSAAIDRAKAYADAGADLIFTEALGTPDEFEQFRAAVDTPLLANMTEFGKSELLTARQLADIGYNMVIYPVTTLRLAMYAVEAGLREIDAAGTQSGLLDRMQHRSRLYELLRYPEYSQFDSDVYNFSLQGTTR
jgi:methylisocitrate lyase